MPQRRSPFGYGIGDGDRTGSTPATAMPMTGTGTDAQAYSTDFDQTPGAVPMESPASLRRRLMPVAGRMKSSTDALAVLKQILGDEGGY